MDKRILRLLNALAIIAAGGFMAGIAGSASFGSQGLEGMAFGLIYAINLGIAFWVLAHLLREWRRWRDEERQRRPGRGPGVSSNAPSAAANPDRGGAD